MRTSPIHYIAPSAISIVPNCNGSANDIAVTIVRNTTIKVYSPRAGIERTASGDYREWALTGRNRRLSDSTIPYTIYARLPKYGNNGAYLVFAKKTLREDKWIDAYSGLTTDTTDGYYALYTDNGFDVKVKSPDYFYVRLGDVSLPDANNQRTVTLDTGILGTEQFNDEWALHPDELPLRIELGCTINDEDVGPTPYVRWGQSLVLTAMLSEGWMGTDVQRFDRWEIIRNSGDAAADNAWNYQQTAGQDTLTPRQMPDGQIALQHIFGGTDDFNGAVSVTFTILAVGHNADTLQREILKTATINIMAETVATYELEQSSAAVTCNPLNNTYSPDNVVTFRIRTKAQDGSVSFADDSHIAAAQLRLYALPEGDAAENRTRLTFTDGIATLPVTAFAGGKSINLWLENGAQVVLARTTVAYIRYGEKGDTPISIYRWYKVGLTPLKPTSTSSEEPAPAAGDATGAANVYPTDKWSKTAPDRPATGEWTLWMCGSIRHGNGAIDAWSTPVRISGTDGAAGEDGSDREYIYIRQDTFPFSGTLPANITTPDASSTGQTVADDDFVPVGWSDTALPADNDNRYVYMSVREKPAGINQQWGPFDNPVLWSNWGVRGTDGDGVEHVFIRTQNNVVPVMDSVQTGYASDEFRPTITADSQTASLTEQAQTTDDPKGPNSTYPYEWVATRSKGDAATDGTRQWTKYTGKNNDYTMSLWSRWAEDGVPPEQIYIHTSNYPYNGSTPASVDADGNVPSGWSATPVGVSQQYPYEYRSVRRKINGHWGTWSTPQLDAKWSSDGTSISIKGGADMVIGWDESLPNTDTDGFRCLMNNNDLDDMEVYEIDDWQQLTGSWQGYSADIGDIYLVDGDMLMKQNNTATASSPRWKNLGKIQGPAGNDGKNAVRIDLDNQADIIACREDGTVRFTRIVTVHVSIYDGGSPVTAGVSTPQTVQDMEIAGVTPTTFSLVDGLLTVTWQFLAGTTITPGSYTKDITLNYNGESYTAQFSLTSSNTSAVYQLHPNMSEVGFHVDANGNYTPSSQDVYCGYTKTDGGGTQTFPGNNIANLWREDGAPYNIFWRRQLSDGTFSGWRRTKDLPSGVRSIDSTTTDIGIEFAMSLASSISLLSDQNIIDRELVAIVKGGKDGTSPWIADIDNEMDSVACNLNGHPERVQTVETKVGMFYGNIPKACSIAVFDTVESGNSYENGVQHDEIVTGVKVTWNQSTGVITAQFDPSTDFSSGKIIFCIKLTPTEDSTQYRYLYFTVNGIRPGATGEAATTYQLVPSVSGIIRRKDGTYSPTSLTCYCTSLKAGTATDNPAEATMQYSYNGSNWTVFTGSTSFAASTIYAQTGKKLYLQLLVDGKVMDKETIPVLEEGDDAQEVNPNILLRTVFDRGMNFVLEAWTRNSELIAIDSATDTIVNGRKSMRMDASALSQDLDFQQNVFGKVKPSTWYTLSFNYFATQSFHTILFDANNTTPWIDLTKGCYIDGADTPTDVTRIDGFHEWPAEWSGNRHSITFKTASRFAANTLYVLFRCLQGGQVAICMPKLEEGRTATAYMAHESDLKGDNAPYNEHAYALSRSRTSHADGDLYQVNGVRWFPSAPDPMATHPYVWERIMHYTAAGVNDQTSYICLTGAVGAMGKLCYMAGEYREDVEYTSNDSQTVAVEVSGTNDTTDIYYLNAESNWPDGTAQSAIGPTDGVVIDGKPVWVQGMSQYNLVRARYLFADFAQFGAAVVSGDWLISVHGTINGTAYEGKYTDPDTYINGGEEKPTYFWFDPAYPNEDHAGKYKTPGSSSSGQWASDHHNFIPNYAVNLLTGKTYQNNAYIRGEVYAHKGEFSGLLTKKETVITSSNINSYAIQAMSSNGLYLDLTKTGTYVTFKDMTQETYIAMPQVPGSYENYPEPEKEFVRSLVGNKVMFYNKSSVIIQFVGNFSEGSQEYYNSIALAPGRMFFMECKIRSYKGNSSSNRTDYEDIYWEYIKTKIDN